MYQQIHKLFLRRQNIFVVAALCALLLASIGVPPASASAEEQADEIFVTRVGQESTLDAIVRESLNNARYKARALNLLGEWQERLSRGEDVAGLQGEAPGQSLAEKSKRIASAINEINGVAASDSSDGGANAPLVIQSRASGLDPNTFPVRGEAGIFYWRELTLIVAGRVCLPSGCAEDTDRITCRITVNPGATISVLSWNCLYSPDAGGFDEKHFEMWAINRGTAMTPHDTGDLFQGSGRSDKEYLRSDRDLNGDVLTVAVALWAHAAPTGEYLYDGAKTADAVCHTADNSCTYVFDL